MKITAKILTIAATAILALSALGLLLCIVFQEPLIQFLFNRSADLRFYYFDSVMALLTKIPIAEIVTLTITLLTGMVLCFTVCAKKVGWWTEIIALVALVGAPGLHSVIDVVQWWLIGNCLDTNGVVYYSYMSNLTTYATTFVGFAVYLLLIACGMSIVYKHLTRKALKDKTKE